MEQKIRNIMIAFVSLVSDRSVAMPIRYEDIEGKPYMAIQTNEAAIVAVQRMFPQRPLSELFLIVSRDVQEKLAPVPAGEEPCTHQQFLERRLLKEYPYLQGHFHYFPYFDSTNNMDQNLLDVAEIAQGILAYANQYPDEKIIIHADMTGGMRHVSMMMLSIMQMLKYSGIVIGEVLYSDARQPHPRVYKATQIQRMFTLINGADEFVKFGSVNAIKEYFHNKEISPELRYLLNAMERFSQAIHLCQTESMQAVLEQLRDAIDKFQRYEQKDLQEQLFNGLLATIRQKYGKLLLPHSSILDIIRWCLENEFWQQALTLCTERLPVYFVEHKLAYTNNLALQRFCAVEGKKMSRNWQQDFIITCHKANISGKAQKWQQSEILSVKDLRIILQQLADHVIDVNQAIKKAKTCPKLHSFLQEYQQGRALYNSCRNRTAHFTDFFSLYPVFTEMLQDIYASKKLSRTYQDTFQQFIAGVSYVKIVPQAALIANSILEHWLPATDEQIMLEASANKEYELDKTPLVLSKETGKDKKWQNRQKSYRKMYQAGALLSKLEYADMIAVLRDYYDIRQKRNEINHANANDTILLTELRTYIETYLDRLEQRA